MDTMLRDEKNEVKRLERRFRELNESRKIYARLSCQPCGSCEHNDSGLNRVDNFRVVNFFISSRNCTSFKRRAIKEGLSMLNNNRPTLAKAGVIITGADHHWSQGGVCDLRAEYIAKHAWHDVFHKTVKNDFVSASPRVGLLMPKSVAMSRRVYKGTRTGILDPVKESLEFPYEEKKQLPSVFD